MAQVINTEMSKQMSSIMRLAWQFVKTEGMSMSDALKTAWRNAKVHYLMREGYVNFVFIKKNGETRNAKGTTRLDILPNGALKGGQRTSNPQTHQVYYDYDKGDWRCFRRSSLLKIG